MLYIQVAYVVLYGYLDMSLKREVHMNKTVCSIAFVLFFVGLSLNAMEQATTTAQPATGTIARICNKCPLKAAFTKVLSWCKSHPVYLAAGISVAAIATVCLTCPFVKNKVREYLGLESQQESLRFEPCFCGTETNDEQFAGLKNVKKVENSNLDPLREL